MFTLDAYAARSCPVKTHNAFHPGLTVPTAANEELREVFHGGVVFEAEVLRELQHGFGGSVLDARELSELPAHEQEKITLAAMAAGVQVLIAPLLPRDGEQHRSGRPDLLLRADDGGYQPVEVKFHRVSDPRHEPASLTWSSVTDPLVQHQLPGRRFRYNWRLNDLLQLAHYQRMLQRLGRASAAPLAAVVGTDDLPGLGRVLSWVDLSLPVVPPSPRDRIDPYDVELVSPLERYDSEHAFRVELAKAASALSPGDPPLLEPIANRECGWCHWWDVCRPQLADDDLSLRISKSPLDVHEIGVLRDLGVATVTELAASDLTVLLPLYLPQVTHRVGAEDRLRLAWRRSVLMAKGVDFDRATDGPIDVPAAVIEIDLDIETSVGDRVYLWGFLVSDARDGSHYYRHFSAFEELDDESEAALADAAMSWLRELVEGVDALVFHYSDYEVVRLERLARRSESAVLQWALDWARQRYFDLFTVVRTHFFGTQGLGLKVVATKAAGFGWRDATPGGLNSQAWFDEAVSGETYDLREAARLRVLEYNEDDVEATWHVRRWLRSLT